MFKPYRFFTVPFWFCVARTALIIAVFVAIFLAFQGAEAAEALTGSELTGLAE